MNSSATPAVSTSPLALKWVTTYTDFLTSVLGLRVLLNNDAPHGVMQSVMTEKIRAVMELADQFNSLGSCPTLCFAGDELTLWLAVVSHATSDCGETLASSAPLAQRIASLSESQRSWDKFCTVVKKLPNTFGESIPVLDPIYLQPYRLSHLFQQRLRAYAVVHTTDELFSQELDEAIIR